MCLRTLYAVRVVRIVGDVLDQTVVPVFMVILVDIVRLTTGTYLNTSCRLWSSCWCNYTLCRDPLSLHMEKKVFLVRNAVIISVRNSLSDQTKCQTVVITFRIPSATCDIFSLIIAGNHKVLTVKIYFSEWITGRNFLLHLKKKSSRCF